MREYGRVRAEGRAPLRPEGPGGVSILPPGPSGLPCPPANDQGLTALDPGLFYEASYTTPGPGPQARSFQGGMGFQRDVGD